MTMGRCAPRPAKILAPAEDTADVILQTHMRKRQTLRLPKLMKILQKQVVLSVFPYGDITNPSVCMMGAFMNSAHIIKRFAISILAVLAFGAAPAAAATASPDDATVSVEVSTCESGDERCEDKLPTCAAMASLCSSEIYKTLMQEQCPKTCNWCGEN